MAVITSATEIGNTRPSGLRSESVARIHEVGFYCLTSATWDEVPSTYDAAPSPTFAEHADALLRDSYSGSSTPNPTVFEHPCMPLTKIISAGTFYYALEPHWDLSSRLQHRLAREDNAAKDMGTYDDRFVWNEYVVRSLLDFRERLDPQEREELDRCQFIVRVSYAVDRDSFPKTSPGTRHTRLCWSLYRAITGSANQWLSHDCYNFFDIAPWMEASRHPLQHERC